MYDKQKMMMAYVMVFIVVMIAKIAFESSRICESVAPHIVGTMVTLCLIIILVQSTKINVNTRATIGLILIYALSSPSHCYASQWSGLQLGKAPFFVPRLPPGTP